MTATPGKIAVIFLDIGGVLLEVDEVGFVRQLSSLIGADLAELARRLEGPALDPLERGRMTLQEYYRETVVPSDLNGEMTYARFEELWLAMMGEPTPVAGMLPRLREQAPVWLLSNTNRVHLKALWERYDFIRQVDGVITSCEVGLRKPEREMFRLALERAGVKAEEALFIDDREVNVVAAREAGLNAYNYAEVRSKTSVDFGTIRLKVNGDAEP
jgi:putative hydrolase of the HAD superfamily